MQITKALHYKGAGALVMSTDMLRRLIYCRFITRATLC